MQSEAAILVDSLEALRVLHSHEEFLSQVLKGFVSGQIQAVETRVSSWQLIWCSPLLNCEQLRPIRTIKLGKAIHGHS